MAWHIIQSVKERYPIVRFDESFYVKFTIHLCASLSNHSEYQITITYVYSDYWEYHRKIIEQLINIIGEKGGIKQAVSVSDYFPAAGDYSAIRRTVGTLYQQKQYAFFRENFLHFFDACCFLFYSGHNYLELLELMCAHAMELGFTTSEFYGDVRKRERLSNTAFYEVAVPHSLSVNALRSFISIAICTPPVSWGDSRRNVKIVLLLGVAENERKTFSHIFELWQSDDFSSFLTTMDSIAQTVSFD